MDNAPMPANPFTSLRKQIADAYLTRDDLSMVCTDLDINYDHLPGDALLKKIDSLILHHHQRDQLPKLLNYLRAERPGRSWPDPTKFRNIPFPSPEKDRKQISAFWLLLVTVLIVVVAGIGIFALTRGLSSFGGDQISPSPVSSLADSATSTSLPTEPLTQTSSATPTEFLVPIEEPTSLPTLTESSTATPTETPTHTPTSTQTPCLPLIQVVNESSLAVRAGPNIRHDPPIDYLYEGDNVNVIGEAGNWYQIKLEDGTEGWASAAYIESVNECEIGVFSTPESTPTLPPQPAPTSAPPPPTPPTPTPDDPAATNTPIPELSGTDTPAAIAPTATEDS